MSKVLCWLGLHKLYVMCRYTGGFDGKRVGCRRCSKMWAMNDRLKIIVPWDSEFAEMYGDYSKG